MADSASTSSTTEDILKRWSEHIVVTQEALAEEIRTLHGDHGDQNRRMNELEMRLVREISDIKICYAQDNAKRAADISGAIAAVKKDLEEKVEKLKSAVDGIKVTAGIIAGVGGTVLPVIVTVGMKLLGK